MNKIEKLSKEQFAEETSVIYLNVFQEIDKLFDKYTKIDSEFEKEIDELHKRSVEQMIEYGKVLAKKEEETAITDIISNTSKIESLDFKDVKLNDSSDDFLSGYFKKINNYKDKPYYSRVIDSLIDVNKGMKKEWTKKGELFSNKVEFYKAFTSGEYKKILKEKKE